MEAEADWVMQRRSNSGGTAVAEAHSGKERAVVFSAVSYPCGHCTVSGHQVRHSQKEIKSPWTGHQCWGGRKEERNGKGSEGEGGEGREKREGPEGKACIPCLVLNCHPSNQTGPAVYSLESILTHHKTESLWSLKETLKSYVHPITSQICWVDFFHMSNRNGWQR